MICSLKHTHFHTVRRNERTKEMGMSLVLLHAQGKKFNIKIPNIYRKGILYSVIWDDKQF